MVQVQLYPKFGTFSSFCFLIKLQEIPFVGSCPPFTFTPGHPVRWEAWRMPWSKNRPFVRSSKKQCVRRSNMCLETTEQSGCGFFGWEVLVVDFFLFRLGLCEILERKQTKNSELVEDFQEVIILIYLQIRELSGATNLHPTSQWKIPIYHPQPPLAGKITLSSEKKTPSSYFGVCALIFWLPSWTPIWVNNFNNGCCSSI